MSTWELRDFLDRFEQWIERDTPDDDERVVVMAWIHGLQTDPFRAASRRAEIGANVWFAEVPDTDDGAYVVVSTYFVNPDARVVTCWNIVTLCLPIE